MSLTFNNVGKPVAKIKGGKYNNKIISINPDINDNDATDFKHLKIANESKFQHIPDTTHGDGDVKYHLGYAGARVAPQFFSSAAAHTASVKRHGAALIDDDTAPPAHLDYEMWTGPAPMRPYNEMVHPRGWRAFMEYGNGIVGDMCIHMLDTVRWMLKLCIGEMNGVMSVTRIRYCTTPVMNRLSGSRSYRRNRRNRRN